MNPSIMVLIGLMLAAAIYAVTASEILLAAIGLALVSAFLSCVLFLMNMPLAGVFELSVCAGLITVVFIAAISLTRPDHEKGVDDLARAKRGRLLSLAALVVLVLIVAAAFFGLPKVLDLPVFAADNQSVRETMWMVRRFDMVGQIAAILTGVYAVVALFQSREPELDRINRKPRK